MRLWLLRLVARMLWLDLTIVEPGEEPREWWAVNPEPWMECPRWRYIKQPTRPRGFTDVRGPLTEKEADAMRGVVRA